MNFNELHIIGLPIKEGGNVFKDQIGSNVTQNIKKKDIAATIKWLESITKLPLKDNTLGSVGKKAISGDLDLLVDQNQISKDELTQRLTKWVEKQGFIPTEWIKRSGISVHFKTPIKGNAKNGFVQVDFMFHKEPDWMKFSMHSAGNDSVFSGAERNMLMSSIAKAKGLKYSWQKGLVRREDESVISKDPDTIARMLLGTNASNEQLFSVENIKVEVLKDPSLVEDLKKLIKSLQEIEGKKPGQIRADHEELDRLKKIFGDLLFENSPKI